MQTTTGIDEYLVSLVSRALCTCFELQEMCWPCEHVMAWDDQEGRSFHRHFHRCWRVSSWKALYTSIIPSFICNDIPVSTACWPPAIAIKQGRHHMVRIQSGSTVGRPRFVGEDVVRDSLGNLFLRYPLDDNPNNVDAMPNKETVVAREEAHSGSRRKRKPGLNAGKCTCSKCGKVRHNRRTCKGMSPSQPVDIPSQGTGPRQPADVPSQGSFKLTKLQILHLLFAALYYSNEVFHDYAGCT